MDIKKLVNGLHPLERKVVPILGRASSLKEVVELSGLKEVEAMRALQWLSNKKVLELKVDLREVVMLDKNGKDYFEKGLPERRFLKALEDNELKMDDVMEEAGLSKQEVNICIGLLKSKAALEIKKGMVLSLTDQGRKLLIKETFEEMLVKRLGTDKEIEIKELKDEERFALDNLKKRKDIIKVEVVKERSIVLTDLGKKLVREDISQEDVIENLTPKMLKDQSWKEKEFRRFDVSINVPKICGGKRHFVRQAMDYVRQVWTDLGFKEMTGPLLDTSFWCFDALYVPQDHPARDLQDTFFIKNPKYGQLPDKSLVDAVKKMHENGGKLDSTGYQYKWKEEEARKNVLRTHTTILSAHTLAQLKKDDLPAKYFSVGRCFRNETVDWAHLFEFNQVDGIVVDPDVNFRNHIAFLREFFRKLGYPKARFRPAYFPYTEMSLEIDVWHPIKKTWLELGGTGIFRPELTEPLLGEPIPVLAWGPGFDRIIMDYYKITDMRDLYKNDLKQLRQMKQWLL